MKREKKRKKNLQIINYTDIKIEIKNFVVSIRKGGEGRDRRRRGFMY